MREKIYQSRHLKPGVVMHQLVGMGEMRRMGEMREKIYLNLPHLPHLHSSQKDQLLMTTPPGRSQPIHKIFTSAQYSFIHKPLDSDTLLSY